MIFIIEEQPKHRSIVPYQSSSYFTAFFEFYDFLNNWAVLKIEDHDLSTEKKYDANMAISTEYELEEACEDIKINLNELIRLLIKA